MSFNKLKESFVNLRMRADIIYDRLTVVVTFDDKGYYSIKRNGIFLQLFRKALNKNYKIEDYYDKPINYSDHETHEINAPKEFRNSVSNYIVFCVFIIYVILSLLSPLVNLFL